MKKKKQWLLGMVLMLVLFPQTISAMHIMEGFLPPAWCIAWGVITLPFVVKGFYSIREIIEQNPRTKILLAMAGAFAFVLSALKLPSLTGTCSHPTGIGFGAILFGPTAMSVIGIIVLLFQALMLAHGGLTTLGANAFSMAVVGPIAAYGIYKVVRKLNGSQSIAIFLGAAIGNLLTYTTTSVQLAMAFPAEAGGFTVSLVKFLGIFAVTQIPLAISEGILTVLMFKAIAVYSKNELQDLKVLSREVF